MKGRIVSVICGTYVVLADGVFFNVKPKGVFRNLNLKPVVGDYVELDESYSLICDIYPRCNCLIRPNMSNIDHILIVLSMVEPEFSYFLACKYLAYANVNSIHASLVITKIDKVKDKNKVEEIKNDFERLGVNVYLVDNKTKVGIENIKNDLRGKTICTMGQSGVGKSSLINAIDVDFDREIGEFSVSRGRGKHQTKEVIMLPYNEGFIVDTPGFSDLDIKISATDLAMYFPGFKAYAVKCYFRNCLHEKEKLCKVLEAVNNNEISKEIYNSYVLLLNEIKENWRPY